MLIKAINRKINFEYNVIQEIEAGIVLVGNEVKSIRGNKVDIASAYVVFEKNEAFVLNMHIDEYKFDSSNNRLHDPKRKRKLLLNRMEINRMYGKVQAGNNTIVLSKLYFKGGFVKATIALVQGKDKKDKREYLKAKEDKREMRSANW